MAPLYTYSCGSCGDVQEHLVSCRDRDELDCGRCGARLERHGVERFAIGAPAYQMGAILADGTHVPGHYGKDAKRRRKKR